MHLKSRFLLALCAALLVPAASHAKGTLRATITTCSPSRTTAECDSPVRPASRFSVGCTARGNRAEAR